MSLEEQTKAARHNQPDDTQIQLIEDIRRYGDALEVLIDQLQTYPDHDPRWLAMGKTDLQVGLMKTMRSITKPEFF